MVLDKDKLVERIKEYVGEREDDDTIAFLEDINDSIDNLSSGEDWEQKYKDNDAAWRKKYKERFFAGSNDNDDDSLINPPIKKQYRYEDLFTVN